MDKNTSISVIIPTYKCPDALDLCLRSCIEGQNNNNQIIVIVDGFYDLNQEVLWKYDTVEVIVHAVNLGVCTSINEGVYEAKHQHILVVNDDNVFPKDWDVKLMSQFKPDCVLSPNQIEPNPSMFNQFHIQDLGRDPKTFDLDKFNQELSNIDKFSNIELSGGTLPFLMEKKNFMMLGGWDENYPLGLVADWEFFYKCQLANLSLVRTYGVHFYHFESLSTGKTKEQKEYRYYKEREAHNYFKSKWGGYLQNFPNNIKYIKYE